MSPYTTVNAASIEVQGGFSSANVSHAVNLGMPKRVGTFPLSKSSEAWAGFSGGTVYLATSGSITVTRLTATTIAGTYSFVGTSIRNAADTKAITNGIFNMDL
jgi:hypothetical protein